MKASITEIALKLWVELLVLIVILVTIVSCFGLMGVGGWIALFASMGWAGWRLSATDWSGLRNWKAHVLFLILLAACAVSLCFGPHSFVDSFSYRLPQLFFWLQEGRPWSVPNVDMRINQMPHVWPFISSVFYLPFKTWGVAIPNLISFTLIYLVLAAFVRRTDIPWKKGQWILAVFTASPVVVMQAPSNDNVLSCVALLMIALYFCIIEKSKNKAVVYSALAFALACGIKPQYVTLAPLWLIWFFGGKHAPVRQFKWPTLVWLAPLILLCSPFPTFAVNQILHGSYSNPVVLDDRANMSPEENLPNETAKSSMASYTMLVSQMLALPVNPFAGKLNQLNLAASEKYPALKKVGWDKIRVYPLLIAEKASFSLFASLMLAAGLIASRNGNRPVKITALISFLAMILAIQMTAPSTLGRSFIGFFFLMLPLSYYGINRLPLVVVRSVSVLALLMGLLTVCINPACPIWPVEIVEAKVGNASLRQQLEQYSLFSKRHMAASSFNEIIPSTEEKIGCVLDAGMPITELWGYGRRLRNVLPLPVNVDRQRINEEDLEYLIVRHSGIIKDGSLDEAFLHAVGGRVIAMEDHTSYMRRGDERWVLVQISH